MTRVIEPTDVGHLPEVDRQFPVIVEYTEWHVVWVHADDLADAAQAIEDNPYEYTSSETAKDGDYQTSAPQRESEWYGLVDRKHDAHVEQHRSHLAYIERLHLAATVDDETRDGVSDADRRTCAACKQWREDSHDESAYHLSEVQWQAWQRQRDAERAHLDRQEAERAADTVIATPRAHAARVGEHYDAMLVGLVLGYQDVHQTVLVDPTTGIEVTIAAGCGDLTLIRATREPGSTGGASPVGPTGTGVPA